MEIKKVLNQVKDKVMDTVKDTVKEIKQSDTYANITNNIYDDDFHSIKEKILNKIKEYNTIIIHRHVRPDGDAIGSSLGLREILKTSFPDKKIYSVGDELPEYLKFVGEEDVIDETEYTDALVIVVDTATSDRICDSRFKLGKEIIKIDHHVPTENYGTSINYVRENYGSCSLVIMDMFTNFSSFIINKAAARYLYIATITDTGRFRYKEVDGKALEIASKMLNIGVDTDAIYANLYSKNIENFKFQAYIYKNVCFTENKVAYLFLTKKIMKKYKISTEDASNTVNLLDGIKGSMIWLLFIERDKEIRVRLRSRFVPVIGIAQQFNGGGHECASGATVYNKKQIKELLKIADNTLKDFKEQNKDKF